MGCSSGLSSCGRDTIEPRYSQVPGKMEIKFEIAWSYLLVKLKSFVGLPSHSTSQRRFWPEELHRPVNLMRLPPLQSLLILYLELRERSELDRDWPLTQANKSTAYKSRNKQKCPSQALVIQMYLFNKVTTIGKENALKHVKA